MLTSSTIASAETAAPPPSAATPSGIPEGSDAPEVKAPPPPAAPPEDQANAAVPPTSGTNAPAEVPTAAADTAPTPAVKSQRANTGSYELNNSTAPAVAPTAGAGYGEPKPVGFQDHSEEDRWFGRRGQVVLGVENLFGLSSVTETVTDTVTGLNSTDEVDISISSTQFSLLGQGGGGYSGPGLGLDAFVSDRISLGGAVSFLTRKTGSPEFDGEDLSPNSDDSTDTQSVALHLRFGAAFTGKSVAFWPRAGVAWAWRSVQAPDSGNAISGTAFTLEGNIVVPMGEGSRVAVLLSPSFFIPITGSIEPDSSIESSERDLSVRVLALNVGLVALPWR